jgi:vitamin B12 transporter
MSLYASPLRRSSTFVAVLSLGTTLCGSLASAQAPTDTFRLAPLVVTATRIPTPADAVPVAVTVLTGAQLHAEGIRTVADALRLVPGATVVTTNSFGSQTSLFLRGGESDYVKVLIDGVPQNQPGGSYDFANLSTDNVDRIEVVRGPVSVLYGSDAVAGVVQVFTREGVGGGHGIIGIRGGSYGTADLGVTLAGGTARASYSLKGSRFTSDGVLSLNNAYRDQTVSGLFRLAPDDRNSMALSLRYADALYHFPTDYTGAPTSNNQHQLDRGPSVGLDLGHLFSPGLDAHLTADWHRDNLQYAIGPNDATDTSVFSPHAPFNSSDWVTRIGVDGRTNVHLSSGDIVTVGGAFERERMDGTTLADTEHARNNGAAYVQLVTGVSRPMSWTLGARLDDNQRFGSYGTYRAGLSWRFATRTRFIGSVGTGFKEPSFFDNFATGFVYGNPNLRPEHSFSWEAGLEHAHPSGLVLRATYFNQRFRDLIDYNGARTDTSYFNIPAARAQGIEVGATVPMGAGWWGSASYTFLYTRVIDGGSDSSATAQFRTGEPLVRRPEHAATLSLSGLLPGGGRASVVAAFTGDRQDIDFAAGGRVTLHPYTRVDVSADYPLIRSRGAVPGVTVNLRVENAFGARYQEVLSFPARGRTILFGGEFSFGS